MKTVHNPRLKEDERHSRGYLPINYYSMVIENREQILHTHWHDEWEFFCVTKGQLQFQINDERFLLEAEDVAVVLPGQIHAGFAIEHGSCTYNALVFHSNLLAAPQFDVIFQRYIAPIIDGQVQLPLKLSHNDPHQAEIIQLIYRTIEILQTQPVAYEMMIKSCMFSVFANLVNNYFSANNKQVSAESLSYRAERMRNIYDYIHHNSSKKITIAQIAKEVSMSAGYLCRFYKEMTGRTITEYINHYRVAQAALLIESTDKKLLEVALDTGFNSLSYFVSQFKRYMGATPSEFKRAQWEHKNK